MTQLNPVLPTANICWRDNTLYSLDFNDFYYSKVNGIEESNYVFNQGNQLAQRWKNFETQQQNQFSIFETGFGSGLNFLITAQYWLDFQNQTKPEYLKKLHYTSVEAHPLKVEDLQKVINSWPTKFELAKALIQTYPPAIKGIYHLDFSSIEFKLILMPLDQALAAIEPKGTPLYDCLFLDGFAPAKNQTMWKPEQLRRLSYFCKNGSTFATFTAASKVQKNLKNCGYQIKKIKGFGSKREMLTGVLKQDKLPKYKSKHPWYEYTNSKKSNRPVIIIGAGIAGCATAFALAKQGVQSLVIDAANEAGGTIAHFPVSSFSPYLSADFNPISQFYWSGYYLLAQYLSQHNQIEHKFSGVFHVADNRERLETYHCMYSLLKSSGLNLKWIKAEQTLQTTGIKISFPGLFNPNAGWLNVQNLCGSLTDSSLISLRLNSKVNNLKADNDNWHIEADQQSFETNHVILCTGAGSNLLNDFNLCRLDHMQGQLSSINQTTELQSFKTIINNGHYLIPNQNKQQILIGSNYEQAPSSLAKPTIEADIENLSAFAGLSPELDWLINQQIHDFTNSKISISPAGTRLSTRDHLPLIGPVPDMSFYQENYPDYIKSGRLKSCPDPRYIDGLFVNTAHGSRGITASLLSGEIIASLLAGKQLPVPTKLYHAIHPARFFVRDTFVIPSIAEESP